MRSRDQEFESGHAVKAFLYGLDEFGEDQPITVDSHGGISIARAGLSSRVPVGAQYALAVSTVVIRLTVPPNANCAEIYVRTNAVVFTRWDTDPTATLGFQADADELITLNSRAELDLFKVIRESANATLDIEYFTDLSG